MRDDNIGVACHTSQFLQGPEPESSRPKGPNGEKVSVLPGDQGNGVDRRAQPPKTGGEVERKDLGAPPVAIGDQLQDPEGTSAPGC